MKKRIGALVLCFVFAFVVLGCFMPTMSVSSVKASGGETKYQRVVSGSVVTTVFETIYYDDIEINTYVPIPALPSYTSGISCGVTAGGVTIAYYQKKFPDLIPGHVAGRQIANSWVWTGGAAITNLFIELDEKMGGHGSDGVTLQEYIWGTGYYSIQKGFQFFISEQRTGNNSVSSSFKTHLANGRLVALFLDGYNITSTGGVVHYNGFDTIALTEFEGAHIMTAFGYEEIKYKDSNGNVVREDLYARVHTGISGLGWIRLSSNCKIDSATVTNIY